MSHYVLRRSDIKLLNELEELAKFNEYEVEITFINGITTSDYTVVYDFMIKNDINTYCFDVDEFINSKGTNYTIKNSTHSFSIVCVKQDSYKYLTINIDSYHIKDRDNALYYRFNYVRNIQSNLTDKGVILNKYIKNGVVDTNGVIKLFAKKFAQYVENDGYFENL